MSMVAFDKNIVTAMHNKNIKILVISDAWHPQVNGVVRTYEHLSTVLAADGHRMDVIGPADFPRRIGLPGYSEIELALFPYRRLRTLMASHQDADHIHIATEGPLGKAARRYCLRRGRRFTTAYHTHFPDYLARRVQKYLPPLAAPARHIAIAALRRFHNASNGIIIATQSLEDALRAWDFKAPLYRVSRGADLALFRPATGDKKHYADLPRPVALYVGRIAIEKNLEDFLAMEWPGGKAVIGDGPDKAMLESRFPDARFYGTKKGDELAAYFRDADLFVFPSRTDTFGMVIVEALASGLPVAGYQVMGPKDIITLPVLGALHDSDLAQAARLAISHDGGAAERHDHVRTHYTWPVVARHFLDALAQAEHR